VHQRVDILQAFLVNDTRRKIYCKNTLRSQRVNISNVFFLYQKLGYFNIKWRLWFEPLTSCTNTLTMISHDYHTLCSDCSPNLENLELSHLSPLNNPERSQQRPALCSYFSPETGALIFLSFIV